MEGVRPISLPKSTVDVLTKLVPVKVRMMLAAPAVAEV